MRYYMGIDIGTSSVKTILVDEKGKTVSGGQEEYEIYRPQSRYAQQDEDMDEIWEAIIWCDQRFGKAIRKL